MHLIRPIFLLLLVFTLAACSSSPVKSDKPAVEREKPTSSSSTPSKSGGYYLDDGPGNNPPPDIDSIPDAVPRAETPLARANKPYKALGMHYVPMTTYAPYKQTGVASWYGKRYHGQKTSSGEVYDMYGMTGAHTTLPLPSYVRVTNPENGRSVIVRINDRGPFHNDRIIDLSYAAAYKLRLLEKGSGKVEVEAIDTRIGAPPNVATPATVPKEPEVTTGVATPAPVVAPPPASIEVPAAQIGGSFVQVGAFKYQDNADRLCEKLRQQNLAQNGDSGDVDVASWYNDGIYRVRLGPYTNRAEAEKAASRIKQALGANAIVIDQ